MKITKKTNNMTSFDSLNEGIVFMYDDGVYMKIESTYGDDNGNYDNAVSLAYGSLHYFDSYTMVHIVQCELVIE